MNTVRHSGPSQRVDVASILWLDAGLLAGCLVVSLSVTAALLWNCEIKAFVRGMILAGSLPLLLGAPIVAYLSRQIMLLSRLNEKLESYAFRDGLTKLYNRGAFTVRVEGQLAEMESLETARGALMIADADHFKSINDRWGHAVGDEALRLIGLTLERVLHREDAIGRLGGEEFGIFLYGSSPDAARAVAERLRASVEAIQLTTDDGQTVPITISLGAVHFGNSLPFATLYNLADRNLYLAKAGGRNRVVFENAKLEVYREQAA